MLIFSTLHKKTQARAHYLLIEGNLCQDLSNRLKNHNLLFSLTSMYCYCVRKSFFFVKCCGMFIGYSQAYSLHFYYTLVFFIHLCYMYTTLIVFLSNLQEELYFDCACHLMYDVLNLPSI